MAGPEHPKGLVGHSKGALLIDFVLDQFLRRMAGRAHRYYDELRVVTVSAIVSVPKEFKRTSQIIGKLHWFGSINSLPGMLLEKKSES